MKLIAKQDLFTLSVKKGQEFDAAPATAAMLIAHGYAIAAGTEAPKIETAAATPVAETADRKPRRSSAALSA